jgi:solute carrier family 50 protein (sugar transporter)
MDLLTVVGFIANIMSIIFYIAPTMIIIDLCKTKDWKKVPYLMFSFTILNCLFWFIYGFQKNFWAVYLNNGIGIVLNSIYLCIFISHVPDLSLTMKIIMNIFVITFNVTFIVNFFLFVKNVEIAGTIAMIFNILMFFSSLQKIVEVFAYRDNSYIPFLTIVSLMFACALWLLYGILQKMNMYLVIPNSLGLTISLFQVILWFIFNHPDELQKKEPINEDPAKENLLGNEDKKDKSFSLIN